MYQNKLSEFDNEVSFSKELYEIFKTIQKDKTLDSDQSRIITKAIEKFELS